ncbi:hypothetical protein CEXT_452071 [Caerostris extrusa]|uniref:Uncharacterized protein n=1 Tax=Caerostris extrusa TaxID=172846 RepID=A0AAV4N0Z1_CAEEX|nr:hypothetical protein CEXT_452071 [Caerostris extrusa]
MGKRNTTQTMKYLASCATIFPPRVTVKCRSGFRGVRVVYLSHTSAPAQQVKRGVTSGVAPAAKQARSLFPAQLTICASLLREQNKSIAFFEFVVCRP